jgi:hypothetical protein
MAKYEPKTKKTTVSVDQFLSGVEPARRDDCDTLVAMMREVTGEEPRMWGPSIVGFGDYHYVYASGHEGDICEVGFSPRKGELSLYLSSDIQSEFPRELAKLGRHRTGKACLYVKRLADIDLAVLRKMLEKSVASTRKRKRN